MEGDFFSHFDNYLDYIDEQITTLIILTVLAYNLCHLISLKWKCFLITISIIYYLFSLFRLWRDLQTSVSVKARSLDQNKWTTNFAIYNFMIYKTLNGCHLANLRMTYTDTARCPSHGKSSMTIYWPIRTWCRWFENFDIQLKMRYFYFLYIAQLHIFQIYKES